AHAASRQVKAACGKLQVVGLHGIQFDMIEKASLLASSRLCQEVRRGIDANHPSSVPDEKAERERHMAEAAIDIERAVTGLGVNCLREQHAELPQRAGARRQLVGFLALRLGPARRQDRFAVEDGHERLGLLAGVGSFGAGPLSTASVWLV